MKRAGKILLCLASGLAGNAIAHANDVVLPNNPYALVVTRNVFGLNPPAPATVPAPADPPLRITPNGILSIFGHVQVLFKVTVVKPGVPAKDQFYNLSEGQSEDDIEVTRIDEKNGIVTFNNHGTVQELPLIATSASGGSAPMPAGGINMTPRIPVPAMANGGNGYTRFGANGTLGGRNPNFGNGGNNPDANNGANFGGNSYGGNSGQQPQETLTPEAQVILMEKNRIDTQDLVNQGKMPPLPPTPLTPDDATGNNGQPLVQLPSIPGQ
jgi:hypothetical protein